MNVKEVLKQFLIGFIIGIFPDPEDMKPERIQFWKDLVSMFWNQDGNALVRTITVESSRAASTLATILAGDLKHHGYQPDSIEVVGNSVTLRLTTASAGKATERDYAAAVLIDLLV